jgi:TctA family transporter
MVAVLSKGSALAGVLSAITGLMIGFIGIAPTASQFRYTFDSLYLFDGIPLAVLALGLFALPEMVDLVILNKAVADEGLSATGGRFQGVRDVFRNKRLVLRNAVLGSFIGFIPGLGGAVVDWIAYGVTKRTAKDNEGFGEGDIRGVIGPESANNAKEGGTMIPTLLFGIPGSGTTAILLGGLVLLGI